MTEKYNILVIKYFLYRNNSKNTNITLRSGNVRRCRTNTLYNGSLQ